MKIVTRNYAKPSQAIIIYLTEFIINLWQFCGTTFDYFTYIKIKVQIVYLLRSIFQVLIC